MANKEDLDQAAERAREVLPPALADLVYWYCKWYFAVPNTAEHKSSLVREILALPSLAADREALANLVHDAWHSDFAGAAGKHYLVADALLARYDIRERGETA